MIITIETTDTTVQEAWESLRAFGELSTITDLANANHWLLNLKMEQTTGPVTIVKFKLDNTKED